MPSKRLGAHVSAPLEHKGWPTLYRHAQHVKWATLRCGTILLLQVLVARIQGPDSPFAHYIANLPVGVSGVPMFFAREALEAIEYPPVVEQVRFGVLSCAATSTVPL